MRHNEDCSHDHDHDHEDHSPAEIPFGGDEIYRNHGIRFCHPGDWTVTEEAGPDVLTISIQSHGTSFWTLTLFEDAPDPADILETAITVYRDEYTDLDESEPPELLPVPVAGREIDFVCLDSVNWATLIAFRTNRRTVLIVSQATDFESKLTRPVMELMTKSFSCEEGLALNGGEPDEIDGLDDLELPNPLN